MEFRELQYITTIAECGSISKAAEKLYVAQSSLSQFLKKKESSLDCCLFTRTYQGMIPTQEGILYLETAQHILRLQKNFLTQLSEIGELKQGSVSFTVSPYRSPYILPLVLPVFYQRYPNIHVQIVENNSLQQEEILQKGLVDLGFLLLPSEEGIINYETAITEEVFLAVPDGHPVLQKTQIDQKENKRWIDMCDVANEGFLLYSVNHRLREFSEQLFAEHKISPRVLQEHSSFETLIRLADVGMGLTFIPETYIFQNSRLHFISIGKKGIHRTLVLGYPPFGYISKATRAFSQVLIEELKKQKEGIRRYLATHNGTG